MTTQRAQQTDAPGALPRLPSRPEVKAPPPGPPPGQDQVQAQLAGAMAALAGRVERLAALVESIARPPVSYDQRQAALAAARVWVDGVAQPYPRVSMESRVDTEIRVAGFLTGET